MHLKIQSWWKFTSRKSIGSKEKPQGKRREEPHSRLTHYQGTWWTQQYGRWYPESSALTATKTCAAAGMQCSFLFAFVGYPKIIWAAFLCGLCSWCSASDERNWPALNFWLHKLANNTHNDRERRVSTATVWSVLFFSFFDSNRIRRFNIRGIFAPG